MTKVSLTFCYYLKRSVVTVVTRVQQKNVSTRIVVPYVMCHKLQKNDTYKPPYLRVKKNWHLIRGLEPRSRLWIRKQSTQTNSITCELFHCVG